MFRKFQADHLFTGRELLSGNHVLIAQPDGTICEIIPASFAGDDIEKLGGLVTPGFVNAHCHLELSHLKGRIPAKTGLIEFVQQVIFSREPQSSTSAEREQHQQFKLEAMRKAEEEMYQAGIVAVGDICNTTDSIAIKRESKLHWRNFIEVSGFVASSAEDRLATAMKVLNEFSQEPSLTPGQLTPHAPYSVSEMLFNLLNRQTGGQLITIHNQESAAEAALFRDGSGDFLKLYQQLGIDSSGFRPSGKSSFASWLPKFDLGQQVISVHNTFINEADILFATNLVNNFGREITFCLCVNANMYIENQSPPFDLFQAFPGKITLGTDSYASNNQLSILSEIKAIEKLTGYGVPLSDLLNWSTLNGAEALQFQELLGSFDPGKTPGIVLLENLTDLHTNDQTSSRRIL